MLKIVLFGSNGFVGHNIKDHFSCNDNYSLLAPSSEECNLLNLLEVEAYLKQYNPDFIINASFIGVDSKREYSDEYLFNNILLQTNVMKASRYVTNLKKLFVFGSGLECSDEDNLISEDSPITPKNTYATIKAINTLLYQDFARQYSLPLVIFRLFNLYGPYDTKSVIYYLASSVLLEKDFKVTKGDQVRDYLYCGDVPVIVETAIQEYKNITDGEIYNMATGEGTKLRDMFSMIFRETSYTKTLHSLDSPRNEYWKQTADIQKIKASISYPRLTPLDVGIKKTISWIKESLT